MLQDGQAHRRTLRSVALFVSLPLGFLSFILPVYGEAVGASPVAIGALFSVFSLVTVLFRPVIGAGVDRYGRRPFLLAGIGVYVGTQVVFALWQSYHGLFVARLLHGLASSLFWLAVYASIADTSPEGERGRHYGGVAEAQSRGALFGALGGFALLMMLGGRLETGLRLVFLAYALLAAAGWITGWRRLRETLPEPGPRPAQAVGPNVRRPGAPGRDPLAEGAPHLPKWFYSRLLAIVLLTTASNSLLAPLMILYLRQHVEREVGLLAIAYIPAALVWSLLPSTMGRLSDRFGRTRAMTVGLAAGALTSFAIPQLRSLLGLSGLWAVEAGALSLAVPAEQALVSDVTGHRRRGLAYGYYELASGLGNIVGPLVGMWVYQSVGTAAPFYLNAGLLALAAVLVPLILGRALGAPARQDAGAAKG
ncbi:MAG: MFS transporter [Acetobacteraceae bacterium]|nr:MFS transporter [Acetobacteraceae bacterium]